jgi:hypothetical protein
MTTLSTRGPWGLALFGLVGISVLLSGCTGSKVKPVGVNGEALIGLTQERLRACAGAPLHEVSQAASTLLVYYREAAMFEESFGGGKGSKPGYHHGCWVTILLEDRRVSGVEFRPVPDPDADTHECQEIFPACAS